MKIPRFGLSLLAVALVAPLSSAYDTWYEPLDVRALVEERTRLQAKPGEPILQYIRFDDWSLIAETVKRLRAEGKDVLVTTDLDNTLLTTLTDLGSEQWFDGMYDALKPLKAKDKALFDERFEMLLQLSYKVINAAATEPVQADAPEIVAQIQASGAKMIGLTSRGRVIRDVTLRNLLSWNIDLSRSAFGEDLDRLESVKTAPPLKDFPANTSYMGGVFFTSGHNKGSMLMGLLKHLHYRPDVILFVDDKSSHHDKMFASCLAEGLPVFGFQFTLEHPFIVEYKASDKARSRVQMKRFIEDGVLLSDREAELVPGPAPSWAEINQLVYGVGVEDPAVP